MNQYKGHKLESQPTTWVELTNKDTRSKGEKRIEDSSFDKTSKNMDWEMVHAIKKSEGEEWELQIVELISTFHRNHG